MTTVTVTTTPDWLFEASAALYSAWSRSYDELRNVQRERNDGSADWQEFHDKRLEWHTAEEARLSVLKDEASRLATLATAAAK
jgi:hypothetical protein